MNTQLTIGSILGICFVTFIIYAIYKEKRVHRDKPKFHKDIK